MSTVTKSRETWTTRPRTTSPGRTARMLCSNSAPKSLSPPDAAAFRVSSMWIVPPGDVRAVVISPLAVACKRCRPRCHQCAELRHDLFNCPIRGVNHYCVRRRAQRRMCAPAGARGAFGALLRNAFDVGACRATAIHLDRAPPRALHRRGIEKHFDRRVGKNHRADVAALHHHASARTHGALLGHQTFAHCRHGGHFGGLLRRSRGPDRIGEIAFTCVRMNSSVAFNELEVNLIA